jgi:hypothetical protein
MQQSACGVNCPVVNCPIMMCNRDGRQRLCGDILNCCAANCSITSQLSRRQLSHHESAAPSPTVMMCNSDGRQRFLCDVSTCEDTTQKPTQKPRRLPLVPKVTSPRFTILTASQAGATASKRLAALDDALRHDAITPAQHAAVRPVCESGCQALTRDMGPAQAPNCNWRLETPRTPAPTTATRHSARGGGGGLGCNSIRH